MPNYYHPYSEDFLANPWPTFRRMRDEDPAYFVEDLNTWAFSRFDDVWRASMDRTNLSAAFGTTLDALVMGLPAPGAFVFMDPPEHTHHRGLISAPYQVHAVAQLETTLRQRTRELIAKALPTGTLEVYALATSIGLHMIADFMGIKHAEIEHIRTLLDIHFRREPGIRGPTPEGMKAFGDLQAYITGLIEELRRNPPAPETHAHAWLNTAVQGKMLTDEQIFFTIFSLAITGADTMSSVCAGAFYYLAKYPEQMALVRANPALALSAFNEVARFDQPTNILGRRVTKAFELHGKTIEPGQNVMFLFASANRDEREFENADQFLIQRQSPRSLAFGIGTHICIGQNLARLEGRIILEEVLAAIPDFEVDLAESKRLYSEFIQGYCHVPLRFKPR